MEEKQTTSWVSDDGREFTSKEDCENWEKVFDKVRRVQIAATCDTSDMDAQDRCPAEIEALLYEDNDLMDACLEIDWETEQYKGKYEKYAINDANLSPEKIRRLKTFTDWLFDR